MSDRPRALTRQDAEDFLYREAALLDEGRLDEWLALFTDDARYRTSPYAEPKVGHAEIQAFWLDDEGKTFSVIAEPVAVEGRDAVVRLEVRYGDPVAQEYRDLWVLRFSPDGRVEDFEEWPFWPGHGRSP